MRWGWLVLAGTPTPLRVTVHVHPRADRVRRTWDGTRLELWIHQPPVDGAANVATVDAVARWLDVRRRSVRLVSGRASRTKVLEIDGLARLPPPDPVTPPPSGGSG